MKGHTCVPVHTEAVIESGASVHETVTAWRGTHVRSGAVVGANTSLGQYVYVGPGARIGDNCKIQNGAYIYEPAVVSDGVFIGPRVIFTNDRNPRAVTPDERPKDANDWTPVGVYVNTGASIGAGAVCIAPIVIGEWAIVAAGAVVTRDVAAFSLVVGVPARWAGWVGRAGIRLERSGDQWICPSTGDRFVESDVGASIQNFPG